MRARVAPLFVALGLSFGSNLADVDLRAQQRTPASTLTVEDVWLAADRLLADRWFVARPAANPVQAPEAVKPATPTADEQLLLDALASRNNAVRRVAVRALGRFENPLDVPALTPYLTDGDPDVRTEAAHAMAQALFRSRGAAVLSAKTALVASLEKETAPPVKAAKLEALARLKYDHDAAGEVAALLASSPAALVIQVRQDHAIRLDQLRVAALERMALGDLAALESLYLMGGVNFELATRALSYTCPPPAPAECGWSTRFLAVQQLDLKIPALAEKLDTLRHDAAYQVRVVALRKLGQQIPLRQTCRALLDAAADEHEFPVVRLEAAGLLDPRCTERDEISTWLATTARQLGAAGPPIDWHLPAKALEALVRFNPAEASRIIVSAGMTAGTWQVRAASARAAATLKNESLLLALAGDREANVRTEVVTGLAQTKNPAATRVAVEALQSADHQLVRAAAMALRGTTQAEVVAPALMAALTRLTTTGADNSRDARIAIFDRFKELARSSVPGVSLTPYVNAEDLRPWLRDFDPNVAAAAADTMAILLGTRPDPTPTRRPPAQPTAADLKDLPKRATLTLDDASTIALRLLPEEAPLSVYRFVKLAKAGYYDGLTFHRVVPLFVIQGGSPGANEYVGDARFMRDEIGLEHHTRGTVGLSTRGRDTGDAQIFIDLTDQPRLNYDYTIFGRVISPMGNRSALSSDLAMLDSILEGTRIRHVTIDR